MTKTTPEFRPAYYAFQSVSCGPDCPFENDGSYCHECDRAKVYHKGPVSGEWSPSNPCALDFLTDERPGAAPDGLFFRVNPTLSIAERLWLATRERLHDMEPWGGDS